MSRARARRRRGAESRSWMAWAVSVLAAALIASAIAWAVLAQKDTVLLDEVTLCPKGRPPSGLTVVLVDATDSTSRMQQLAVLNRLERAIDNLALYERVELYQIAPGDDLPAPVLSVCRPPRPDEVSDLTGNKRLAFKRFEESYKPKLKQTLDALLTAPAAASSPIMEGVQAVTVRSLLAPDLPTGSDFHKRLIVVSDLMQFSPLANHYRGALDYDAFRASPDFAHTASDLNGVDVTLLYLNRASARDVQGGGHIEFWLRWFGDQGATSDGVVRVEG